LIYIENLKIIDFAIDSAAFPGTNPFSDLGLELAFHVPAVITWLFATDSSQEKPLVLDFFMSRQQQPGCLPQIQARRSPLCLLFSCPGSNNLAVCHRFKLGGDPCARFFHVPVAITWASATDLSWEEPLLPAFVMSQSQKLSLLLQSLGRRGIDSLCRKSKEPSP
jgi:hypothetical protein